MEGVGWAHSATPLQLPAATTPYPTKPTSAPCPPPSPTPTPSFGPPPHPLLKVSVGPRCWRTLVISPHTPHPPTNSPHHHHWRMLGISLHHPGTPTPTVTPHTSHPRVSTAPPSTASMRSLCYRTLMTPRPPPQPRNHPPDRLDGVAVLADVCDLVAGAVGGPRVGHGVAVVPAQGDR